MLDTPAKTEDALIHRTSGLLPYRKDILNALLVSDSQSCEGYKDQWVLEVEGYAVLRERGPIPRGWTAPKYEVVNDHTYLCTTLTVYGNFDQNL